MEYFLHIIILICIYSILTQSLSIVAGYSGQLSLAHASFYGIGAYTAALLSINYNLTLISIIPIAMVHAGIIAFIVAKIASKTIDDYFIIITLGIQVVIYSILNNWQEVTRGPLGISSIPDAKLFSFVFNDKLSYLLLSLMCLIVIWTIIYNLTNSPFGRVLKALSEDEVFTKSLGKDVHKAKIISFTVSGMLASVSGILYAHYISYIDPTSFTINESIFILSIVIIGGMKNLKYIFLATAFLIFLPEALRFIGITSSIAANMKQIFYGLALVIVAFKYYDKK